MLEKFLFRLRFKEIQRFASEDVRIHARDVKNYYFELMQKREELRKFITRSEVLDIARLEELNDIRGLNYEDVGEYLKNNREVSTVSTGGTTGVPKQYPSGRSDEYFSFIAPRLARARLGISPDARMLHIWGHAHVFGKKKAYPQHIKTLLKPYLTNYRYFSAYDVSTTGLQNLLAVINKYRPSLVISYASVARMYYNFVIERSLKTYIPQTWVVTAEQTFEEEFEAYRGVICRDLLSEYGTVECGAVAYRKNEGRFITINPLFVTSVKSKSIRITSITDREFPMIGFEPGDDVDKFSRGEFKCVIGRNNKLVKITNNGVDFVYHSELFVHVLKNYLPVGTQYQICNSESKIILRIKINTLSDDVCKRIKHHLLSEMKIDKSALSIETVLEIVQSKSGKIPLIVEI